MWMLSPPSDKREVRHYVSPSTGVSPCIRPQGGSARKALVRRLEQDGEVPEGEPSRTACRDDPLTSRYGTTGPTWLRSPAWLPLICHVCHGLTAPGPSRFSDAVSKAGRNYGSELGRTSTGATTASRSRPPSTVVVESSYPPPRGEIADTRALAQAEGR